MFIIHLDPAGAVAPNTNLVAVDAVQAALGVRVDSPRHFSGRRSFAIDKTLGCAILLGPI